jgi:hypothetical protein
MDSEAAEKRSLLVCIGMRAEENAALWRWACACFLEPQRDAVSFVYARTETTQLLVRARRRVQSDALSLLFPCVLPPRARLAAHAPRQPAPGGPLLHQSSNRVLHAHAPPDWMPPAIAKDEMLDTFATPPRFLEIVSDLGPGDAIVDWLERSAVGRPDVVLLGACCNTLGCARTGVDARVFVCVCFLGSRGFTGLRRFLLGSVSSYIMEMEAAPCLVVRSSLPRRAMCGEGAQEPLQQREEGGPSELPSAAAAALPPVPPAERSRAVGIAVDGTPEGTTALVQWARQFVLRPEDRVTILHGRPDKPKARRMHACHAACPAARMALTCIVFLPALADGR